MLVLVVETTKVLDDERVLLELEDDRIELDVDV